MFPRNEFAKANWQSKSVLYKHILSETWLRLQPPVNGLTIYGLIPLYFAVTQSWKVKKKYLYICLQRCMCGKERSVSVFSGNAPLPIGDTAVI